MTRRLMAEIDRLKADLAIATAAMWATLRAIAAKPDLPGRLVYDALHDEYKRIKEPNAETLQALKDCDEGNVTSYADADEFFAGLDEPDSDVDWEDITAMSRSDEIPYERQLFAKAILANKDGVTANRLNLAQVVDDIAANKAEINDLKIEYKGTCASLGLERINRRYETTDLRKRVAELEKRVPTDEQMTTAMLRAAKNKLVEKQRYDEAAKVREVIKMLTGKPTPPEECSKEEHDRLRKQAADVGIAAAKKKPECTCVHHQGNTVYRRDPNCPIHGVQPTHNAECTCHPLQVLSDCPIHGTKEPECICEKEPNGIILTENYNPNCPKCNPKEPATIETMYTPDELECTCKEVFADKPVGKYFDSLKGKPDEPQPEPIIPLKHKGDYKVQSPDEPIKPGTLVWIEYDGEWYVTSHGLETDATLPTVTPLETSVGRIAIEALKRIAHDDYNLDQSIEIADKALDAIGNTITIDKGEG